MRVRILAACLSLSLAACEGPDGSAPNGPREDAARAGDGLSPQEARQALSALPGVEVLGAHEDGTPYLLRGDLGSTGGPLRDVTAREAHARLGPALASLAPVFRLRPDELVVRRASGDDRGHTHVRYAQTRQGLPVIGHELVLHVDETGRVYAANGSARGGGHAPVQARLSAEAACGVARASTPGAEATEEAPRLVYVRDPDGRLHLAHEVVVTGAHAGFPLREHVFVDAVEGTVVERHSDIHDARNRLVYSANNTTSTTGTLKRSEGQAPTGDPVVDKAHDNLGIFYDCYQTLFARDSFDNAGAALKAVVHYGNNFVNAFWNGSQLVCGDGDGVQAGPLCNDMDVVTHEFTHAVTQYESNLVYNHEPGALSESYSDIFSAVCESWSTGTWSMGADTWKIAEDILTPGTPGDALRYMDNPAQDGSSADYYPERYTGTSDNGGVHINSGIPNLAFALLSKGGLHPRGKTSITVTGIGVERAGRIFYKAQTDYFTSSTTFAQAKAYTEQVANLLYGSTVAASVTQAWQAVGVGTQPPPCSSTPLANGIGLRHLSGSAGSTSCPYTLSVPAGATQLKVESSGGTGDADLYVKFGSVPSTSSYDCRPYLSGNNEACTFPLPSAGTYSIVLRGYSAYSGVTLKASFTRPDGSTVLWVPDITGAASSQQYWTYNAMAGQSVTFTLDPSPSGSTGDADLYVRFGTQPTTTAFDCRPYLSGSSERCTLTQPVAGTYHVMLRGFSAYTGVDLTVQ